MNSITPPPPGQHLHIGALIFPQIDQLDFTGTFEVLSKLPNSTFHILAKDLAPVRDIGGLLLTPETTLADAPQLDLLVVPGGNGINALLEDEIILGFIRQHAATDRFTMSVCTGALVLGAAGLLKGRRATTHWASFQLLADFRALPVNERVVVDGNLLTTAGVTSGLDGAFCMAALLRGKVAAEEIQLAIQYAPAPPFNSGTPETAPPAVVEATRQLMGKVIAERTAIARRVGKKLGCVQD